MEKLSSTLCNVHNFGCLNTTGSGWGSHKEVRIIALVRKTGCLKNWLVTVLDILATRIHILSWMQTKISFWITNTMFDAAFMVSLQQDPIEVKHDQPKFTFTSLSLICYISKFIVRRFVCVCVYGDIILLSFHWTNFGQDILHSTENVQILTFGNRFIQAFTYLTKLCETSENFKRNIVTFMTLQLCYENIYHNIIILSDSMLTKLMFGIAMYYITGLWKELLSNPWKWWNASMYFQTVIIVWLWRTLQNCDIH